MTVVGIDLGTTYSAVASVGVSGKPQILPNRDGERITPSVVLFQGDQTMVGSMAKRAAPTAPDDVAQFVKRSIGNPSWRMATSTGEEYTAEEVSAIILRRLVDDAAMALGMDVTDAVITVPAYFGDALRKATIDAGTIAGLNVLRVINEPTAAALAYGLDAADSGTVLVYDLGGGTFDVTIMRMGDGLFDVVATMGDRNLGGFDWDNEIMTYVNDQVMAQGGPDLLDDDLKTADLRDKAEMAKRSLTSVQTAKVFISADGANYTVPITREDFEQMTAGLLGRTEDIVDVVLSDAGMTWRDIDKLLLVGGSTRMPMVAERMTQLSGMQPERSIDPDEAVALGAAIQAHLLASERGGTLVPLDSAQGAKIIVSDVTALGLGVLSIDPSTGRMVNNVLIPHNSKVPSKGRDTFCTVRESQAQVRLQITEGDDTDADYVKVVGESFFDLPPYPEGSPIDVAISYDIDGIVHAEIFDGVTASKLGDMEIARESNLDVEQVQQKAREFREKEID